MTYEGGLTRRRLLALCGAGLVGVLAPRTARGAALAPARPARRAAARDAYVTRPDLNPPPIEVRAPAQRAARGYVFLAPFDITAASGSYVTTPASESRSGPLIVDDAGEPVWFLPLGSQTAMNLQVQEYRGRPVLTWYEGTVLGAYGGSFVVYDRTYHEVARVRAGRGRHGDLHEFLLTPEGTALITIYLEVRADLTSVGGPVDGRLVEGIVQEVDVASGRVLFEWRSLDHVPLAESYRTETTPAGNVDYFHLNSIAVDLDGHLLISSRHTWTVYKVHRRTGAVIWRLGGKRGNFAIDADASFRYQHDVRRHPDGTLTIFDNNAADPGTGASSRGIRIALDEKARRASLVQEYATADPRDGWAMGNVQQLSDGGVFVGWGTDGSFSEFGPDGVLRYDARFTDGSVGYRAFRLPWVGRPTGEPALAATRDDDGTLTVHASWNGATEVAAWEVSAGPSSDRLRAVVASPRSAFETAIPVPGASGYVSVAALDASGRRLGQATPIPV